MAIQIENKKVLKVVVFLLIFSIAIWRIVTMYSKLGELNKKKVDIETQITNETAILAELKKLDNAKDEINKVMFAIPDGDKMPDFILQLSELAEKSALNLTSIDSINEVEVEGQMKKKNVVLMLAGDRDNFKVFIKSLETLSRFTSVSSIKLDQDKNNFSLFTVNVSIYYFFKMI